MIRGVEQLRGTCKSHQVDGAEVAICSNGGSGALFTDVMLLGIGPPVSTLRPQPTGIPVPRPSPTLSRVLGRTPKRGELTFQRCTELWFRRAPGRSSSAPGASAAIRSE